MSFRPGIDDERDDDARTGDEIKTIMSGMMGMRLKRLMRPLIKLKVFLLRRRGMQRVRQQHISHPTSPAVVNVAMVSPVLSLFGREQVTVLMRSARLRTYEPGEVMLYRDEPAEASGLLIVASGELASVNHFTGEHTAIEAPLVLRDTAMLTEEPAPAKVVAKEVTDVFILKLQDVRQTFRALDSAALEKLRALTLSARRDAFSAAFAQSELFMRLSWVSQRLSDAEMREALLSRLVPVVFFPGDTICSAGAPADAFWCIRRGIAGVINSDGEEAARIGFGATVGELSLCFRERFNATVRAVTIVDAWCMRRYDMEHALEATSGVGNLIRATAVATRKAWLLDHKERTAAVHIPALRALPYLADAPAPVLRRLFDAAVPVVSTVHSPILSVSDNCDGLYIIARGLAAAQRLETRENLRHKYRYGEGSVVGENCVLEHRNPVSVCALRMVDAWHIPREVLIAELRHLGEAVYNTALAAAAAELRRLELELRLDIIPPRPPPSNAAPVQRPAQPVPRSARFLINEPLVYGNDSGAARPPPTMPAAHDRESLRPASGGGRRSSLAGPARAADPALLRPEESAWVRCRTHADFPDIDLGPADAVAVMAPVSHLPTARVEKLRSVAELGGVRLLASPSLRRQLVAAAASFDPDASNSPARPGAAPNERGDLQAAAEDGDEPSRPPTETEDALDEKRRQRDRRRRERMDARRRSKLPATFTVVREAETVGDWAPWLFALLQRKPALEGFLEGSEPGPLDVVDSEATSGRPSHIHSPCASVELGFSHDTLPMGSVESRPVSQSSWQSPHSTALPSPAISDLPGSHGRRVVRAKKQAAPATNRYAPRHPHSYSYEPSVAQAEADARARRAAVEAAAAQKASARATSASPRRGVTLVEPTADPEDLITRIVQHGAETVDMAKDDRLATPSDNFFQLEWESMMSANTAPASPPPPHPPATSSSGAPREQPAGEPRRQRPTPLTIHAPSEPAEHHGTPAGQTSTATSGASMMLSRRYSGIGAFAGRGGGGGGDASILVSEDTMSLASPLRPDTPEIKPWRGRKRKPHTTKPANLSRSHFAGQQDRTPNMARLHLLGVGATPPKKRAAAPSAAAAAVPPPPVRGKSSHGMRSQLVV